MDFANEHKKADCLRTPRTLGCAVEIGAGLILRIARRGPGAAMD
jgi:hypothetical protein